MIFAFAEEEAAAATAAAEVTPGPDTTAPARSASPMTGFIIAGVVIGFVLSVVLAIRKANKKFGKEW